jgi:hypothetical protein
MAQHRSKSLGAISVPPTLRKVREGWGTRSIVVSMKSWATRQDADEIDSIHRTLGFNWRNIAISLINRESK